ncbi:AEC family transporter [Paenibacillus sp. ACRSA]|uniref:AEC family transporter n=1 Tax=Paenibacillus sp. ACRSA TaxID=2918211 RepID=UPI001EF6CE6D|nr:AEC family transporter [Paenibacillus sp. ACRSA]MCG7376702.1 AEC family transporter [Paenibacillus sp. ACRSA]
MLHSFMLTLYHVFLPISLPVIAGLLLKRFKNWDTRPLSTFSLYILSPALIFDTLLHAEITWTDVTSTLWFSIINLVALWLLAELLSRLFQLGASEKAGLTLVSTFTNCVNYGLPLVLLAFGQLGLDKASVYVIGQMIIVNTLGIFFAARSEFTVRKAMLSVFRMPSIYAAAIAIVLRANELRLPEALDGGISMIATGYAPVVLAILGAQMLRPRGSTEPWLPNVRRAFWTGLIVRLAAAPILSYLILRALQVEGTLFSVLLILSSMPTAVNAVILAEQFNASPQFVSRCILWTTVASMGILPIMIVMVS